MTKFGPKLAFWVNLGQAMQAYSMPCCGSVGGCGARAVSRKTPIYFICNADRGELQIQIDLNPFLCELITELLYVLVCMVCVPLEL